MKRSNRDRMMELIDQADNAIVLTTKNKGDDIYLDIELNDTKDTSTTLTIISFLQSELTKMSEEVVQQVADVTSRDINEHLNNAIFQLTALQCINPAIESDLDDILRELNSVIDIVGPDQELGLDMDGIDDGDITEEDLGDIE